MELTAFAFEVLDGVAHLTMAQAERGNPFDERFAEEFDYLATECAVRLDVRAVLIDARGRFFSVGGDLIIYEAACNVSIDGYAGAGQFETHWPKNYLEHLVAAAKGR
jgi:enoyl-CoA hydratase/carnithine racemase